MFAPRYLVFASRGPIPQSLNKLLELGTVLPDGPFPRLVAAFEGGADAERLTEALTTHHIASFVAGPAQPPVQDMWTTSTLARVGNAWQVHSAQTIEPLDLSALERITTVQLSTGGRLTARGTLIRSAGRALLLRHEDPSDQVARQLVLEFFEDVTRLRPTLVARQRTFELDALNALGLDADWLALLVAATEALDTTPAMLPTALSIKSTIISSDINRPPSAAWLGAIAVLVMTVTLIGSIWLVMRKELSDWPAWLLGLSAAGWSSQRLYWAQHWRHLRREHAQWPLNETEVGTRPRWFGLGFDLGVLTSALLLRQALPPLPDFASVALTLGLGMLVTTVWCVATQRAVEKSADER